MLNPFKKKEAIKPEAPCKIDIVIQEVEQKTLSKLPPTGNSDLIIEGQTVKHKKYGYIGKIPDNKFNRLAKLQQYTYFWKVYNNYADTEDSSEVKILSRGINLKIY